MLKAALVELPESEISDRYWGIFALWLPFCQLFKAVAALCSRKTPTTVSVSQDRIAENNYSPETRDLPVGIREG